MMKAATKGAAKVASAVGAAAHVADEDGAEHPGEIADAEIGRADEERHQEQLWAEHVGVVVVAEGEAGEDRKILEEIAHHQADHDEGDDAAPAVAERAVDEREDDHREHMERGQPDARRELADDRLDEDEDDEQPEEVAGGVHDVPPIRARRELATRKVGISHIGPSSRAGPDRSAAPERRWRAPSLTGTGGGTGRRRWVGSSARAGGRWRLARDGDIGSARRWRTPPTTLRWSPLPVPVRDGASSAPWLG